MALLFPVVMNLDEAGRRAGEFDRIVSLVPVIGHRALQQHPSRLEMPFDDVRNAAAPGVVQREQLHAILDFVESGTGSLLVHCRYGQSRSVAVAIGITVASGVEPRAAAATLLAAHPANRAFAPNERVIELFDDLLGLRGKLIATATDFQRL